jgi:DNA-binding response OmpR family regulator
MRVLIVDDEARTRSVLERGLREASFHVESAGDATSGESHALAGTFDAIVLDVVLPDRDGFTLCRRLRTRGIDTPIVLLTGRSELAERVRGLDVGADDYVTKPFALAELVARLRAVTRRGRSRHLDTLLSYGPIRLDQRTRQVTVDHRPVLLRNTEFHLLECLLLRAESPVARADVARHVWADDPGTRSNVMEAHISYLRKRLGPAGALIRTVRGFGYMIAAGGKPRD